MKTPFKVAIVAALLVLAAGVFTLKNRNETKPATTPIPAAVKALPKLIDLGADRCIPCKKMAPILEELKKEKADVFVTEFIDVWKNPDAGKQYNIDLIPTQIFFDATGKELFRHQGFFCKEDILAKWRELGVK